jgi:opacity protein-like surface antigen
MLINAFKTGAWDRNRTDMAFSGRRILSLLFKSVNTAFLGKNTSHRWTFWTAFDHSAVVKRCVFLCLLLPNLALADLYLTIGQGDSIHQHKRDNGWWYQQGFAHEFDEEGNAWSVGVGGLWNKGYGYRPSIYLEAEYQDLGESGRAALWVQPDASYNMSTSACNDPCPPTQMGAINVYVKALTASFLLKWSPNERFNPYVRIGGYYAKSTFEVKASKAFDEDGKPTYYPNATEWDAVTADILRNSSMGGIGGLGAEFNLGKDWTVRGEYTRYFGVGVKDQPHEDVNSIKIHAVLRF